MRNSEKHGKAGLSNAQTKPYRLVGGTHERPVMLLPAARQAMSCGATKPDGMAHYQHALMGGVLAARLGYSFRGHEGLENEIKDGAALAA